MLGYSHPSLRDAPEHERHCNKLRCTPLPSGSVTMTGECAIMAHHSLSHARPSLKIIRLGGERGGNPLNFSDSPLKITRPPVIISHERLIGIRSRFP